MGNSVSSLKWPLTVNRSFYVIITAPVLTFILYKVFRPQIIDKKTSEALKFSHLEDSESPAPSQPSEDKPTKKLHEPDVSTPDFNEIRSQKRPKVIEAELPKPVPNESKPRNSFEFEPPHEITIEKPQPSYEDIQQQIKAEIEASRLQQQQKEEENAARIAEELKLKEEQKRIEELRLAEKLKRKEERRKKREEKKKEEASFQEQERIKARFVERRSNIIKEIIATETSYLDSLVTLHDVFEKPLVESRLLSENTIKQIFSNLSSLIQVHKKLLGNLDKNTAQVFLEAVNDFAIYEEYIVNYNVGINAYNVSLENKGFEEFILKQENNPRCKQLGIHDMLIMPVQRLPRYELLLLDLSRHTEPESPEHAQLLKAHNSIKQLVLSINEKKRLEDSNSRIIALQARQKKKSTTLLKEGRLLVKEGLVTQIAKGKEREIYLFAFNDIIMCSKQTVVRKKVFDNTLRYENEWMFDTCTCVLENAVQTVDLQGVEADVNMCFKLNDSKTQKGVVLKCPNAFEKKLWVDTIKEIITNASQQ